jgi:putative transposase
VWERRFAPLIAEQLRTRATRTKRRSLGTWMRTYVRVKGKWCDLYRAIDAEGNLVDSRLSEKREMEAAQLFFKQALVVVGHSPERVTTDGHATPPIHGQCAKRWAAMCFIEPRNT